MQLHRMIDRTHEVLSQKYSRFCFTSFRSWPTPSTNTTQREHLESTKLPSVLAACAHSIQVAPCGSLNRSAPSVFHRLQKRDWILSHAPLTVSRVTFGCAECQSPLLGHFED